MKIAFIITALAKQGSIYVFKELIENLDKKKVCEIKLFYFDENVEIEIDCPKERITFDKGLPNYNYDVIHSTGIRPDFFIYLNKNKFPASTRFITTIHSFIEKDLANEYNYLVGFLASRFWYKILSVQDSIAVLTLDAYRYYSKFLKSPISIINNGRSPKLNDDIAPDDSRKMDEIKKKYKILGAHAKVTRIKGLDTAIKAMKKLSDYALVVVGKGKDLQELITLSEKLGVKDRCFFLGFRSNITAFFRYYDLYIMPSRSEGMPMALIEAVANKTACLCSDISTFQELFDENEVTKFRLDDVCDFVASVRKLENKSLRNQSIENAYSRYKLEYTASVMANNYFNLYKKVVEQPKEL